MEGYLKDKQGYLILDAYGRPIPEELRDSVVSPLAPPRPVRKSPVAGSTYRPPLRKIGGNPNGTWESIKTWWTGLKPEYRYGIFGGLGLVGIIIAASQKGGGKGSGVKKI